MSCPRDGELRLAVQSEREAATQHIAECDRCRETYSAVRRAAGVSALALARLQPEEPVDARTALRGFKTRTLKGTNGVSEFGKRPRRPLFVAGALALVLAVSLLAAPVRSAASGWLDVFRVERFAAVTIDVSRLPIAGASGLQPAMDRVQGGDLSYFGTYTGPVRPEKVAKVASLEAAEARTGSSLADAGGKLGGLAVTDVYVTEPVTASYTFDTAKINARIKAAGVTNIKVPQQIDGKTFTLRASRGVAVRYGAGAESVVFAQGPSPQLSIPQGVNMDYLRQDFLMIPGLPADLVAQVRQIKDWERTLIVPLPPGGRSSEVKVGGSQGLLISDRTGSYNGVLWQRNGVLYVLGGKLSANKALEAARGVAYP